MSRLLDMGIEPFLVTASVNLVLAQRLARQSARTARSDTRRIPRRSASRLDQEQIVKGPQNPQGCPVCGDTGYKGRIG